MTPSSAATTRIATSVTLAPRARIAVNASWPGVSIKVILRSFFSTVYAPMRCVMPPASPAATLAWRILSSKEVLPWSTWPSTVTTGGRAVISSGRSSSCSTTTSSPASLTSASKPNFFATAMAVSLGMFWLIVAIVPILMSSLMTSRGGTIIDVASSCTVRTSGISIFSSLAGGVERAALLLARFLEQKLLLAILLRLLVFTLARVLAPIAAGRAGAGRRTARHERHTGTPGTRAGRKRPERSIAGRARTSARSAGTAGLYLAGPGLIALPRNAGLPGPRRDAGAPWKSDARAGCCRGGTILRARRLRGRGRPDRALARRNRAQLGNGRRRRGRSGGSGGGRLGSRSTRRRSAFGGGRRRRSGGRTASRDRFEAWNRFRRRRRGRCSGSGRGRLRLDRFRCRHGRGCRFGGGGLRFELGSQQVGDLVVDDAELVFGLEPQAPEQRDQLFRGHAELFCELKNANFTGCHRIL